MQKPQPHRIRIPKECEECWIDYIAKSWSQKVCNKCRKVRDLRSREKYKEKHRNKKK